MPLSTHLYLTGYRGTGKSSVARNLAQRLGVSAIDLDDVVEQTAGTSIAEIFEQAGESGFRDRETAALKSVCQLPAAVVSLGGGTVLRDENRQLIRQTGRCVWLQADAETLAERLNADCTTAARRPALTSLQAADEIRHLLAERRELYESVSQHRVDTNGHTISEVVDQIMVWLS